MNINEQTVSRNLKRTQWPYQPKIAGAGPANIFFYCTASKRTILQWRIYDERCMILLASCLLFFFRKKYVLAIAKYIMVIPARPHALCAGEVNDEKLKINKLESKPYKATIVACDS